MATTVPTQEHLDPLRHHKHYQDAAQGGSPYAGGSSFMERVSEGGASAWAPSASSSSARS